MTLGLCFVTAALFFSFGATLHANDTNLEQQVQLLREQNALLQQQVQKQSQSLDALTQKVQNLEAADSQRENKVDKVAENSAPANDGFSLGKVVVTGEGGVGFQKTGPAGFSPDSSFVVQEARLFLDAPVWKDVYFFSEVDLATPEDNSSQVNLGQLYLDFEDVSQLWGRDGQLNVRAGKMEIPFGEEYQTRNAIDNPLIRNSVSDFWGYDPGLEIYGALGKWSYVVAVQNGGGDMPDNNDDKSVSGRIGFDPDKTWHFSLSGMRTGNINAQNFGLSAEWFGCGFFQSIGSPATTTFNVNAVELDTTARWASGYVRAFGGVAVYDDNDPTRGNGRNIYYYSAEVVQNLPKNFYAVTRFSEAIAANGYPIMGNGNSAEYFSALTTDLWRLSLGIGYRFCDRLIIKTEYAFEGGQQVNGGPRDKENFFGSEIAFKF